MNVKLGVGAKGRI